PTLPIPRQSLHNNDRLIDTPVEREDTMPAVHVDTSRSPHARHRPVPVANVRIDDTFFAPRREINRRDTLQGQYRHLVDTRCVGNFQRAASRDTSTPFAGLWFADSDLYKWLEAVAWAIASDPGDTTDLDTLADQVIAIIAAAQGE